MRLARLVQSLFENLMNKNDNFGCVVVSDGAFIVDHEKTMPFFNFVVKHFSQNRL